MKTLPLPALGAPPVDPGVIACHNIRPDTASGDLVPAQPVAALPYGSRLPVAEYLPDRGSIPVTVFRQERRLCILNRGIETDAVVIPADSYTVDLDGSVLTVHADGLRYRYDIAGGTFRDISEPVVPPRIVARRARQVSTFVCRHTMIRYYSSGESLTDRDASRLSDVAAEAYRRLDAAARITGERFMPVVMALRLSDCRGNVVALTLPRLVTDPDNAPFDGIVDFTSADGKVSDGFDITVPTWRPVVDFSRFSAPPGTYTCEVLATPPLHRVDPDAGYNVSARSRADERYFARAVPAASPVGVWPGASREEFLRDVIGRFETLASVECSFPVTVSDDSDGTPADISVPQIHRGSVAADIRRIREALDRPLMTVDPAMAAVGAPHSFSAGVIGHSPSATLMAALVAAPFRGFPAEAFADTFDPNPRPWHAVARVAMADGSSSVVVSEGAEGAPLTFNPVTGYPGPGAVSLYLSVKIGAEVRSATFDLRPDGSGRRSVAISTAFAPQPLPDVSDTFVIPPESPATVPLRGVLALADSSGTVTCVHRADLGRVTAIVRARHSQGAWDYGRARFLLFASSGIYSVSAASGLGSLSVSLIDPREALVAGAVCDSGRGIWAIASGSLVNISGTRVTTVAPTVAARVLAWDPRREELWLIPPSGDVTVMMTDRRCYTVDSPGDSPDTVQVGGTSYILAGGGCFSPAATAPAADPDAVMGSLDDYERELVAAGCDAEQIAWYRFKLAEMGSREKMMAEFPSTPAEAFIATGNGVFAREAVEALRAGCGPAPVRGDIAAGRWIPDQAGAVAMWEAPHPDAAYVVAVDIGGTTSRADFSVITVMLAADTPRVVAQWRGHCPHDVLARRAMDIGSLYGDALLVVESNSLEGGAGAGFGMYVLDLMAGYPNLYRRRVYDDASRTLSTRIGFHTNRATKEMLVGAMIAAVRDGAYVERDPAACDELLVYERRPDGSYGAREGCHDDMVMSRALALHAVTRLAPRRAECDAAALFGPYW